MSDTPTNTPPVTTSPSTTQYFTKCQQICADGSPASYDKAAVIVNTMIGGTKSSPSEYLSLLPVLSTPLKDTPAYIGSPQTERVLAKYFTTDFATSTMLNDVRLAANYQIPILIQGPTGTGKELIAQALHGPRRGKFVAINCTSLPAELIESELFGHKRGSFTGAVNDRQGKILAADYGTLFLDEIGDMPLDMQAKLLRVLQNKRFCALGDEVEVESQFRLVCATNRDLEQCVANGSFREDLFYRLNSVVLKTLPLSDRIADVGLITHALYPRLAAKFNYEHWEYLDNHAYPGNVRELINRLEYFQVFNKFPAA